MTTIKLSHCFIPVQDQDKALAFYTGALGMQIRTDASFEGMRWLTIGPPAQPEIEIVLAGVGNPDASAADRQVLEELLAKGVLFGLILSTDDCDAAFEQVRATGAEVLQEPVNEPYGVRDCAFRDPSGNMIRLAQELPG